MKRFISSLLCSLFLLFVVGNGYFSDFTSANAAKNYRFQSHHKKSTAAGFGKTSEGNSSQISLNEDNDDMPQVPDAVQLAGVHLVQFWNTPNLLFQKTQKIPLYSGISGNLIAEKTFIRIRVLRI